MKIIVRHIFSMIAGVMLAAAGKSDDVARQENGAEAPVYTVYVSPDGSDAWSGRLKDPASDRQDGPVKTLTRARDVVRQLPRDKAVMIYLRGGTYFMDSPLILSAEDAGTESAPVVWQNYPGETVILTAGLELRGWQEAGGGVLETSVSALPPAEAPLQLFWNGQRLEPARWPDRDKGLLPGGWAIVAARDEQAPKTSFHYAGDRPRKWASWEGIRVSLWPNYNWWHTIAAVAELNPDTRTVRLAVETPYGIEPGRRFYFLNVPEELNAPGEWYFDRKRSVMRLIPPGSMDNARVVFPVGESLVTCRNTRHVALLGLVLEAATGDAVVLSDCESVLVGRCVIRNTGGTGVKVAGGRQCAVTGCDIEDTGLAGISLEGGDRATLTPGGHQAVNNLIRRAGQIQRTYQAAVQGKGVGHRIAHNYIRDLPHIAIWLNGNDHVVEYNDIGRVCQESSDTGAFYMGRNWTERGVILRCNRIHDVAGFGLTGEAGTDTWRYETPYQAWGVYLDDCTSGVLVQGNLIYRVPLCGVMIGGGRDNVVDNNVFFGCIPALHIDARWDSYCWDLMRERFKEVKADQPPYSERYPELATILTEDPRCPARNRFTSNIIWYDREDYRGLSSARPGSAEAVVYDLVPFDPATCVFDRNLIRAPGEPKVLRSDYGKSGEQMVSWADWQKAGFDAGSQTGDPQFVDPASGQFDLKPGSPALKLGFEPIPWERIGLYRDVLRASWPAPSDPAEDVTAHHEWTVQAGPTENTE